MPIRACFAAAMMLAAAAAAASGTIPTAAPPPMIRGASPATTIQNPSAQSALAQRAAPTTPGPARDCAQRLADVRAAYDAMMQSVETQYSLLIRPIADDIDRLTVEIQRLDSSPTRLGFRRQQLVQQRTQLVGNREALEAEKARALAALQAQAAKAASDAEAACVVQ